MLRATFLIGSSRLRMARFSQASRKDPRQWYEEYSHKAWKLSLSR